MDYIKYLDTFGIKFHFYTNNQPNHQNIFGGIMTIIYIIICFTIFFFFCYDDFRRLNPKTNISEITDIKPRSINIKNEKIWIPFRLVTDENKYIDHRGMLYIFPHLVKGEYNDQIGMELNYHSLNYKLCNETGMVNSTENYKIDVPLNELFCIEDDITIGGNWNGKFINYIEISLFLCEDGTYFDLSDPKCSKTKNFFENLKSSLSFDFYYPVVQFQPTNYKNPISIIYRNYFYRLSAYSHKLTKIYIQEHVLSDDRDIIRTNYKNTTCWGTRAIYGDDYYLLTAQDPFIKNKLGEIFTMEIYLDYGLFYYKRSYNKIIFILSNVFPLFRLALYFIKKFTQHVKYSLTKRDLAGLIFINRNVQNISLIKLEQKNEVHKIHEDNSRVELNKRNKNDSLINIIKQQKISLKKNSHKNKEENNDNSSIKNNCNDKSNKSITIENKKNNSMIKKENDKEMNLTNLKRQSLILKEPHKMNNNSSLISNITDFNSWKKKYIFPVHYFYLDFIFDKLIYPQKFFCVSKTYFTVYNFMCQIYDISTHIILFKQFNLLNNVLNKMYEESGYCPARPFKKININDTFIMDQINKDLRSKKSILFSHNLS